MSQENKNKETVQDDNTTPAEETQNSEKKVEGADPEIDKITELELQLAQSKEQLLRKIAEFENYKRRTASEALNFSKYAAENIIVQLLPVIDDLSRSLKSGKDSHPDDPFYKGIELIHGKFIKILESQGLKELETIGKPFDVDYHDAMMQMPRKDVEPHTVVEEIEKGYMLNDKVIRHAKVIVSTSMNENEEEKH